jgi:hypothetical protein
VIKFSHQGVEYTYNEMKMSAAEALLVDDHTGLGMLDLMQGVAAGKVKAIVALLMLAKIRNGELKYGDAAGPDKDKVWQQLVESFDDSGHDLMAFVASFQFLTDAQMAEVEKFRQQLDADPDPPAKPAKRATK